MSAQDEERTNHMWEGAAQGLGLGLVAGALVGLAYYAICSSGAQSAREAAALSYNRSLYQDLRFNVSPAPGGAKVGVQRAF